MVNSELLVVSGSSAFERVKKQSVLSILIPASVAPIGLLLRRNPFIVL